MSGVRTAVEAQVLAAAAALVAAFRAHDTERYFAAFSTDATFLFHSAPRPLGSRAEYEAEWRTWEAEGFKVLDCRSYDAQVHVVCEDLAVFTHRVRTRLSGVEEELRERESIVFHRDGDGCWLAVHEHLSAETGTTDPGKA